MLRCDMLSDVFKLTSGSYRTPPQRMEKSNLHQISYHIQAQELDYVCAHESEKPTVACRPLDFLINLNSMPPQPDSKTSHLSSTFSSTLLFLLREEEEKQQRRLLYD